MTDELDVGAAAAVPTLGSTAASTPPDLKPLIEAYADLHVVREQADERAKALHAEEDIAAGALFDAMERHGLRAVRHERGLFTLNDLAWAKIEDRDAALAWAEANAPELLTLNNQRLSVVAREFVKGERAELPPGVGFTSTRKITWRRS